MGQSKGNQISKIKVNTVSGYCAKCLRELDEDKVVDAEDNEFCDITCRNEYWRENRKEMDSLFSEWRRSGR